MCKFTIWIFKLITYLGLFLLSLSGLHAQSTPYGHFKGSIFRGSIYLEWTIYEPEEIVTMFLEKRTNSNKFETCKIINPNEDLLYLYKDRNPQNGEHDFRIRFDLIDGKQQISEILSFNIATPEVVFNIYPNPSPGDIYAYFPHNSDPENIFHYRIFNSVGQLLFSENIPCRKIRFELNFLSNCLPGTYTFQLLNKNKILNTRRIVKC